ncbi:hypothetical protein WDU94_013046 [Cyamophila willieti]
MFPYEFKEKRVESVSQTKWWLAAGLCGLFITTCFIAITLWLGMNNSTNYTLPSYNFNKIPIPSTTKPPPPLPEIYPSAEILRTNIKSKKGRIEVVHEEKIVEATSPQSVHEELHESTEVEIEDYLEEPSVVSSSSQSSYVQSSLPTSSSTVATSSRNYFQQETTSDASVKGASLADSIPDTQGDSSVTRKKSQALYPAWSEPEGEQNEYQFQPSRRYEHPVETKTTPPFTYNTDNRNRDIPVREHTLNRVRPLQDPFMTIHRDPMIPSPLQAESFHNGISSPRDPSHRDPLMYRKEQLIPSRENDILHVSNDIKNENDLYYVTSKTPTANPMMSFLQKRIQDIHDWIAVNGDAKVKNSDWLDVIQSINQSLTEKNATIILSKIKDLYLNSSELPIASLIYPSGNGSSPITHTPSLISFGLLAIDLFLLHNVQQIAWNEESSIKKDMLSDPDVIAMNALFMPPEKVILLRQANSRVLKDDPASENKGFLHELVEFVNGGLRAAVNLGKAFRSSTSNGQGRSTGSSGSPLDCIWTLYCRNLDKTARLAGPYGFLAKMNR